MIVRSSVVFLKHQLIGLVNLLCFNVYTMIMINVIISVVVIDVFIVIIFMIAIMFVMIYSNNCHICGYWLLLLMVALAFCQNERFSIRLKSLRLFIVFVQFV